jgi:predicted O-methyltransferase YrrM
MRRFRHWTPRYLYDRLALAIYQRRHPDAPWLTAQAIDILRTLIKHTDVALEYGSGRSTLWFARRIAFLTSVESNRIWYEWVSGKLQSLGLHNVNLIFCEECEGGNGEDSMYVHAVDFINPNSLDFVLVDGVYRDICAVKSLDLVKPGGFIIIDNCNWFLPCASRSPGSRRVDQGPVSELWAYFYEVVHNWRYIWTSNGITDTGVWFKPL